MEHMHTTTMENALMLSNIVGNSVRSSNWKLSPTFGKAPVQDPCSAVPGEMAPRPRTGFSLALALSFGRLTGGRGIG